MLLCCWFCVLAMTRTKTDNTLPCALTAPRMLCRFDPRAASSRSSSAMNADMKLWLPRQRVTGTVAGSVFAGSMLLALNTQTLSEAHFALLSLWALLCGVVRTSPPSAYAALVATVTPYVCILSESKAPASVELLVFRCIEQNIIGVLLFVAVEMLLLPSYATETLRSELAGPPCLPPRPSSSVCFRGSSLSSSRPPLLSFLAPLSSLSSCFFLLSPFLASFSSRSSCFLLLSPRAPFSSLPCLTRSNGQSPSPSPSLTAAQHPPQHQLTFQHVIPAFLSTAKSMPRKHNLRTICARNAFSCVQV
eukprot:2347427-Rhodomonas_salina.6